MFENTQINIDELPVVEEVTFQKLDPAYLKVEYIGTTLFFGLLFLGFLFLSLFGRWGFAWWIGLLLGLSIFWFLVALALVKKSYAIAGYALRERDVVQRVGVIWRSVTTIPFNRMQHCEITQGPVEKFFGLSTLKVFTAGGSSSDLSISGIRREDAQRIREFISQKIEEDEK